MAKVLYFLLNYRIPLLLGLTIVVIVSAQILRVSHRRAENSAFALEREINSQRRMWAAAFLLVGLAIGVLIFSITSPLGRVYFPQLPYPTPLPTRPLPTPTPTFLVALPGEPTAAILLTDTPLPEPTQPVQASAGCENPNATISSPLPGAVLSGNVEVIGIANINNFAFYTLEISTKLGTWLTVYTGNQPTAERGGALGNWNTNVIEEQGNYSFRLTVFDGQGNTPAPCIIPVTVIDVATPEN